MAEYEMSKEDMKQRIKVTNNEPFFMREDIQNSMGTARLAIGELLPKSTWITYTDLIDAIDKAEGKAAGYGRKRLNPIYYARVERYRNWIEWEVIPKLSKMVLGN